MVTLVYENYNYFQNSVGYKMSKIRAILFLALVICIAIFSTQASADEVNIKDEVLKFKTEVQVCFLTKEALKS